MMLPSFLALALSAAASLCSKVLPTNQAGNYITPGVLGDLDYAGGLKLDAYAPAGPPRPAAVIIQARNSGKRTHVTQLFDVLERAGYSWFSIEYKAPDDIARALEYIRCRGRFDVTDELVLIGVDAGAEIALDLASQTRVAGVVVFGAVLSTPDSLHSPPRCPVLVFHGAADETTSSEKAAALCRVLPNCEFRLIPGAIHEFENWHPDQWSWKEDLPAWLRHDRRGLWKNIVYSRPGG